MTPERLKTAIPRIDAVSFQAFDEREAGCGPGVLLIVDEAHNRRNTEGVLTQELQACADRAGRVLLLTATPIIIGATVFELPKLLKHHAQVGGHMLQSSVIAGAVAGVAAFVSVWVLMRWFKQHEVKGFTPFAIYCIFAGALALAWKLMH